MPRTDEGTMDVKLAAITRLMDSMLTVDLAERVVNLRADEALQARLDELAGKCNEGILTPEEREEYETYVEAVGYISILQAKARNLLKHQSARA
jgi:hypothetical protein